MKGKDEVSGLTYFGQEEEGIPSGFYTADGFLTSIMWEEEACNGGEGPRRYLRWFGFASYT